MIKSRAIKNLVDENRFYDPLIGTLLFITTTSIAFHKIGFSIKSLSFPLYFYGDEFFGASLVTALMKKQSLVNSDFGWPLGQDFSYALVSQDTVPHAIAAFLGAPANNPYLGLNLYFLLTFGLSSVGFFIAARILGVSRLVASLLAIGTTLLPHHFSTSTQAITVVSYFFLPILISVIAVQIRDRHDSTNQFIKGKSQILWLVFCIISGTIYSYYSLGFLAIIGSLVILYSIFDGNVKAIKSTYLGLIGVLTGFVLVAIPSLLRANSTFGGINYFEGRSWQAAFPNSGSLVQSLSPSYDSFTYKIFAFIHPEWNATFETFTSQLSSYGIFQEGTGAYIGLPIVLLTLLSFFTLARMRNVEGERNYNRRELFTKSDLSLPLIFCWIAILSLLWSWGGGIGQFFAMFVSQSLRGYARFYIFSVISLALAVALLLTLILKSKLKNFLALKVMLASLLCIFAFDGVPLAMYQQSPTIKGAVHEIKTMTNEFPNNCAILQFPVVHFPYESPGWSAYALMGPGILTDRTDLKWSSGAVGGSRGFEFLSKYREFQDQPNEKLLSVAKQDGYCGILIDKNVWDTFHSFAPGENYKRVPASELNEFLSSLGLLETFKLSSNTYFFAKL